IRAETHAIFSRTPNENEDIRDAFAEPGGEAIRGADELACILPAPTHFLVSRIEGEVLVDDEQARRRLEQRRLAQRVDAAAGGEDEAICPECGRIVRRPVAQQVPGN